MAYPVLESTMWQSQISMPTIGAVSSRTTLPSVVGITKSHP